MKDQLSKILAECNTECEFKNPNTFIPSEDEQLIIDLINLFNKKGLGDLEFEFLKKYVIEKEIKGVTFSIEETGEIIKSKLTQTIYLPGLKFTGKSIIQERKLEGGRVISNLYYND